MPKKTRLLTSTGLSTDIIVKFECEIDLNNPNIHDLPKDVEIWMYTRGGHVRLTAPNGVTIKRSGEIRLNHTSDFRWRSDIVERVFSEHIQIWPPAKHSWPDS